MKLWTTLSVLALTSTAISSVAFAKEPMPTYTLNPACVTKVTAMNELLGKTFITPKLNPNGIVTVTVNKTVESLEDMGFTVVHGEIEIKASPLDVELGTDAQEIKIPTITNTLDLGDDCYVVEIKAAL